MFDGWVKFRCGKRRKADVLQFERYLEENIFTLQSQMRNGGYQHGNYEPFTICDPKQRQIHKAAVRDRLVHQAVVNAIEPLFEPRFIYDSFSCRKNKGTHAAVKRLRKFLAQASRNDSQPVFALKCDIHKFFASVEHDKLLNLLARRIRDEQTLRLLAKITASFESSLGKGIPLGNLTSQLFANVYLHELDFFVKHKLRAKYYARYCDDFIIVSHDRDQLLHLIEPIRVFLKSELRLKLHPAKVTVRSWRQGIDFLGYVSKPHCTIIRTKTRKRILKQASSQNLTSYLGVLSHANSFELRQQLLTKLWFDGEMLE